MTPIFLDIETTGTNPQVHQTLEIAIIDEEKGRSVEFGVIHEQLVYEKSRLLKMGHGLRTDLRMLTLNQAAIELSSFFWDIQRSVCGKNVSFDIGFLREIGTINCRYSFVDVGNLWMLPLDNSLVPPMETCCKRAGIPYDEDKAHTAMYDAFLAQQLYKVWYGKSR